MAMPKLPLGTRVKYTPQPEAKAASQMTGATDIWVVGDVSPPDADIMDFAVQAPDGTVKVRQGYCRDFTPLGGASVRAEVLSLVPEEQARALAEQAEIIEAQANALATQTEALAQLEARFQSLIMLNSALDQKVQRRTEELSVMSYRLEKGLLTIGLREDAEAVEDVRMGLVASSGPPGSEAELRSLVDQCGFRGRD